MRTAPSQRGSRVFGPGSRRRVGRLAVTGLAVAGIAVALVFWTNALLARSNGASSNGASSSARYGGIPSWLPTPTLPVGRVVAASAAHPWLAIEGDTVSVHLAHGQVLATAAGPAVPEKVQFPLPPTSPCTFTITFTRAAGRVPLRSAAFTILDELGHLHHPRVTAKGGGPPAANVAPGRTVTLTLRDVLPTGNGQLRWAPKGAKPIVSWDFDVEID